MNRVLILGSPGSGKSTFSRKLGEKTGLKVIHLDYYFHDSRYDYYKDKKAWSKRAEELASPKKWIIDGNYSSTLQNRFKLADTIIFLECSRIRAVYRVIKRRLTYANKQRFDMPENWEETLFLNFLKYIWDFNRKIKPRIMTEMKKYPEKQYIILHDFKETDKYVEDL